MKPYHVALHVSLTEQRLQRLAFRAKQQFQALAECEINGCCHAVLIPKVSKQQNVDKC